MPAGVFVAVCASCRQRSPQCPFFFSYILVLDLKGKNTKMRLILCPGVKCTSSAKTSSQREGIYLKGGYNIRVAKYRPASKTPKIGLTLRFFLL